MSERLHGERLQQEQREGKDSTSWLRERKREGWIKLDPPVPKELAIATGSSRAIFNNRDTGNPWAGNAEKLLWRCDSRSNR